MLRSQLRTAVRSGSVESSRATSVRVPLVGYAKLHVPLVVNDGRCVVQFTVSPTLVPRVVTHGQNPDPRRLGAHFNVFDYRPPR